jgi:hypothetical protein
MSSDTPLSAEAQARLQKTADAVLALQLQLMDKRITEALAPILARLEALERTSGHGGTEPPSSHSESED